MRLLYLLIGRCLAIGSAGYWFLWRRYQMAMFASCGRDVYIGRYCQFTYGAISIGNDVYIGSNACLQSAHGAIIIGNHVMFGPHVHIHGGNHQFRVVGVRMKALTHKEPGSDGVVRICDDVWIGANATILQGVTVGEGSIIGAGAVIIKDVEPYSIVVGNLPRQVLSRFDEETLARHKALLEQAEVPTCRTAGEPGPGNH